jgi:GTPase SAR1 family protein
MVLDRYSHFKEELLSCIDSVSGLDNISGCPCDELKEKVLDNVFNLVVLGQFKRGKTTLINALLGAEILPTAVVPLTSIATVLRYGDRLNITVYFNDGGTEEIELDSLRHYVTEKGNPKNTKDVREVVITYPSSYLKDGVRLIDTPGVGSVYEHNTDVAYQYLPKSDAALFLISVDQPLSRAELDFLKDVRGYSKRIFFLLSKADHYSDSDLREAMEFSVAVLKEATGSEVRIFPVSAKLALEGKLSGTEDLVRRSRLPQFSDVLNNFLMEDKGKVLLLSVTNNLLRAMSQSRLGLELEMKSILTPLRELEEKIRVFEGRKKEVLTEKDDFYLLLDGAVKNIINKTLDEDMKAFRQELILKVSEDFERGYSGRSGMSLKQLREHLEEQVVTGVKQAFASWRSMEDEKLAKTFEAACQRFIVKIDDAVDSLLKFSAELFAVPFEIVGAEAIWSSKSEFYYRFKEQPVGIEIVASSLTLLLPKLIGEKIIRKRVKEYLNRVIDLQSASAGHDFERRLDKSKLTFRWEMSQRIEATIEGISKAIEKGLGRKSEGTQAVENRREVLLETEHRMNEIRDRLMRIQQTE